RGSGEGEMRRNVFFFVLHLVDSIGCARFPRLMFVIVDSHNIPPRVCLYRRRRKKRLPNTQKVAKSPKSQREGLQFSLQITFSQAAGLLGAQERLDRAEAFTSLWR